MLNTSEEKFDVIIVGCGFAGLYLSQLLSEKYKICVIEKNSDLVGPLRTTGSTLYNKKDDIFTLFNISESLIISSYNSVTINSQSESITTEGDDFSWVLLDIPGLKNSIKNKISPTSTILVEHEVVNIIKIEGFYDGVEVKELKTGKKSLIRGKVIVDSTGSCVTLASKIGLKIPKYKSKCYQVDANINTTVTSSKIQMYMGFNFCPSGYAYVFPISENKVRIGTCWTPCLSDSSLVTASLFKDFLKYLKIEISNIENELDVEVFTGGINKSNSHLNLIAIGDSAGHLSPVIGEGIRFAFHSADIASTLIDEYLVTNNKNIFKRFYPIWKDRFGYTFSMSYMLQFILIHINNHFMDKFVHRLSKASARHRNLIFRIFSTKFSVYDIFKIFL